MLSTSRILAFLDHSNPEVRSLAAGVLAEAHDPSPATAEDIQRAIDRFGTPPMASILYHVRDLPHTDQSVDWLLEKISQRRTEEKVRINSIAALKSIGFDVLERNWAKIRDCDAVPADVIEHLEQRLALADQPHDKLWEQFIEFAHENSDVQYVNQVDFDVPDRLIEALARGGEPVAERALAVVGDPSINDWREWYSVELLGRMRYEPATDALIDLLRTDEGDLSEQTMPALARIGGDGIVERLAELFAGECWDFRLEAPIVIGRIRASQSEAALVRLLAEETDAEIVAFLAMSLCELCPSDPQVLQTIRSVILEDRYDSSVVDLEEMLLTIGEMAEWEPPEAAKWRKRIAKDRARRLRQRAELDRMLQSHPSGEPRKAEVAEEEPPLEESPLEEPPLEKPPLIETLRRSEPKVGRNDPCPCGSGKKFKKCCMKMHGLA